MYLAYNFYEYFIPRIISNIVKWPVMTDIDTKINRYFNTYLSIFEIKIDHLINGHSFRYNKQCFIKLRRVYIYTVDFVYFWLL